MPYFHGKRVSAAHLTLLKEAERRGILTAINQGRRSLVEQAAFYAHYLRYGSPLAAYPSPSAPHIKWGREHHALDINDGMVDRVAAMYRELGIPVAFNVRGEPWHMDTTDEAALIRAARSLDGYAGRLATLKPGMRHADVKYAQALLKRKGRWNHTLGKAYGPVMLLAVRGFQKRNGLRADGVIGRKTWAALRS